MDGISLLRRDLPDALIQRHRLQRRLSRRCDGANEEAQFLVRDREPLLPVWHEGQLLILPWGNRSRSCPAPRTHWCEREDLEAGNWSGYRPELVEIPAAYGLARGIWFAVHEHLRGVLVAGRVYPITEPSSHYYEVMTRCRRMPVLIRETI